MSAVRPKVAVFKFSSCDGCQLAILSLEDELLLLSESIDVAYFLEASSHIGAPPYDIAFVEGSVTTAREADRIRTIRDQAKYLVAIGACATAGGIQALRNWSSVESFAQVVYATPEHVEALASSTPLSDHVKVDFELNGCPVNKHQLLEVIAALLKGRAPEIPSYAVCIECKRKGVSCVMVSRGEPCLGPLTHAGCGALCPSFDRGCYGCFGPAEIANPNALVDYLRRHRYSAPDVVRRLRGFTGWAPPLRAASDKMEKTS